jgi:hypothetical protein
MARDVQKTLPFTRRSTNDQQAAPVQSLERKPETASTHISTWPTTSTTLLLKR